MKSLYQHDVYQVRHSVLPLCVLWLAVMGAFATAERQDWLPRWSLLLLTAPAGFFALVQAFHAYLRWTWARKTYRRHLPHLMLRMIGIFPKLARARLDLAKVATHFVLAVAALLLSAMLDVYSVLALAALLSGIAATVLLRVLLPPGGVYLAASDPERIRFFASLSNRTIPGFAALLEVSNLVKPEGGLQEFVVNSVGALNDYRTVNPDEWPVVVGHLIEMAAVIVVDGRDETPGVQFEIERILRNRLEFKTAFVTRDGATPQILSRLNASPRIRPEPFKYLVLSRLYWGFRRLFRRPGVFGYQSEWMLNGSSVGEPVPRVCVWLGLTVWSPRNFLRRINPPSDRDAIARRLERARKVFGGSSALRKSGAWTSGSERLRLDSEDDGKSAKQP